MLNGKALPFVSILLPIRNELACISLCLAALLAQDYPKDGFEILVADGISDDGTRQILKTFGDNYPLIQVFENPGKIVSTGLNTLIPQSKGDILIRVDGHTVIQPDYVKHCVELLTTSGADNVGGRMYAIGHNYTGEVIALASSSPFGVGGARFHYSDKEEWVDTVYLGAWKKEVFQGIGLFDEELIRNQDDEFNYRLRKYGGKILLSPKIKSHYTPRSSLKGLWRQYFQYGFWKVRVLQKHPRQMRPRQFVPPVFVLALITSILASLFYSWGLLFALLVIGLYLLTNFAASILTVKQSGWRYLWLLPLTFATLHISYGCGFLAGLFKFWNRWWQ